MTAGLHTLTGAYALDALDEADQGRFEAHLAECPDCAAEVEELTATAARLGLTLAEPAPAMLRGRVLAEITRVPQTSPGVRLRSVRLRQGRRWLVRAIVTAAVLVVLGAVGVVVAFEQAPTHRSPVPRASPVSQPLVEVLSEPDARAATATGTAGPGTATVVVSDQLDAAVLTVSGLPTLAAYQTYEAWITGPDGTSSMGVFGPVGATGAPLVGTGVRGARAITITVEPVGGSAQPTTTALLWIGMSG